MPQLDRQKMDLSNIVDVEAFTKDIEKLVWWLHSNPGEEAFIWRNDASPVSDHHREVEITLGAKTMEITTLKMNVRIIKALVKTFNKSI